MNNKSEQQYRTDKLSTLSFALDKEQMIHSLGVLARSRYSLGLTVEDLEVEIVRKRNQRCVIRYRLKYSMPRSPKPETWNVIGKVYKPNRGERVFEVMQKLWDTGFARDSLDKIHIPEPLAFSSTLCLLFQEEVPGLPSKQLVKQYEDPEHLRQLARVLAKLHQCQIDMVRPMTIEDHLLRCHPRYPFLAMAIPELADDVRYIVTAARRIIARIGHDDFTPIHGDCHLGQVHLQNGRSWLIDFDALDYGDPAADLGNILVLLRAKTNKNPNMNGLIDALLDEYTAIMGDRVLHRIPLYEGLTYLRRSCKCLRFQKSGWKDKITRMIGLAKNKMNAMELLHAE